MSIATYRGIKYDTERVQKATGNKSLTYRGVAYTSRPVCELERVRNSIIRDRVRHAALIQNARG